MELLCDGVSGRPIGAGTPDTSRRTDASGKLLTRDRHALEGQTSCMSAPLPVSASHLVIFRDQSHSQHGDGVL